MNGNFDIFLVSLDASNKSKVMKDYSKYLITPTNGLVEIEKQSTFSFAHLRSDSFNIGKDEPII